MVMFLSEHFMSRCRCRISRIFCPRKYILLQFIIRNLKIYITMAVHDGIRDIDHAKQSLELFLCECKSYHGAEYSKLTCYSPSASFVARLCAFRSSTVSCAAFTSARERSNSVVGTVPLAVSG